MRCDLFRFGMWGFLFLMSFAILAMDVRAQTLQELADEKLSELDDAIADAEDDVLDAWDEVTFLGFLLEAVYSEISVQLPPSHASTPERLELNGIFDDGAEGWSIASLWVSWADYHVEQAGMHLDMGEMAYQMGDFQTAFDEACDGLDDIDEAYEYLGDAYPQVLNMVDAILELGDFAVANDYDLESWMWDELFLLLITYP